MGEFIMGLAAGVVGSWIVFLLMRKDGATDG